MKQRNVWMFTAVVMLAQHELVAQAPFPVIPGFNIELYAEVSKPVWGTFDPDGVLYVGHEDGSGPLFIRRIGVGGSPVENYGDTTTPDPDSVLFDVDGTVSGVPGSVIVGGGCPPSSAGCISAIHPDQTVATIWGPTSAFKNPTKMIFDVSGRFLGGDDNGRQVVVSVAGALPTTLISRPDNVKSIASDETGRIYVCDWHSSVIRIFDDAGTLLDDSWVDLGTDRINLEFGRGGDWGTDLYAWTQGTMYGIDDAGSATVVGTGFELGGTGGTFGPDGTIYILEHGSSRILRVTSDTPNPGECTGNLDCEDYNDCTSDTCDTGTCVHTPRVAVSSCGSNLDTECTAPDTCLADGTCSSNDVPDGTQCVNAGGSPDLCRAGLCGALSFIGEPFSLDEFASSEPLDFLVINASKTRRETAIKVTDDKGNVSAVILDTIDDGDTYEQHQLPTPPDTPSLANDIAASLCSGGTQLFVAVGSAGSPEMPTAWSCVVEACDTEDPVMSAFVAEVVPVPPGATTGVQMDGTYVSTSGETTAVGSFEHGDGYRKAAIWTRSAEGTWSFAKLPDLGTNTNAEALGMMIVPDGGELAGRIVIVGGVQTASTSHNPATWLETGEGGGTYILHVAPLPVGAIAGHFTGTTIDDLGISSSARGTGSASFGPGYVFSLGGTIELSDGTMRGIRYATTDFTSWNRLVLPPLPGFSHSTVTKVTDNNGNIVWGTSYNMGVREDGQSTLWYVSSNGASVRSTVNVQKLVRGFPAGARMATGFPPDHLIGSDDIFLDGVLHLVGAVYDAPAAGGNALSATAGTSMPHAYSFEELPYVDPTIPAVSEWGMVVMVLLLMCAGMIAIARMPDPAAT